MASGCEKETTCYIPGFLAVRLHRKVGTSVYSGLRYGIYRSLPIRAQNLAVSAISSLRWLHESSPSFRRLVAQLSAMQYWPVVEIERFRRERLVEILLAARNTPFYEGMIPDEAAVRSDPTGVLMTLPILDKRIVSKDAEAFIPRNTSRSKLVKYGTSGTTGFPLRVYWNRASINWERALIWRHRLSVGCQLGRDWMGMLGGHRIVPIDQGVPPFWRECPPARLSYLSTYHISPDNAYHYHKYLYDKGINYLSGYPSALYALALSLRKSSLSYPLRGAFFGAEPLHDFQRKAVEEVFGCYLWDFYGLTERVVSASEFDCRNGLHLNWENSYFEILDPEDKPVKPGEYGELVGTSLSNTAFPLLRYRTGDMTNLLSGECTCGRISPRMAAVDTKVEDLLIMPDGSLLSASNLTFPFKSVEHIHESQIYQPKVDLIIVRLVPDQGYEDQDGARLMEGLEKCLPPSVVLKLELVESIPRTKSGKFAFCLSDVVPATPVS
jgi:phenylacetate-CoA ligase